MRGPSEPLPELHYTALERLRVQRPVDRLAFLADCVKGKFVFDLGALDETAIDAKRGSGDWLHQRLCESASRVVGIDNSARLPVDGIDTLNGGRIIHADIFDLAPVIERFGRPDAIVAGELIEHLPDTSGFLRALKETPALGDVEFIFSTPNACSWHNFLVGLLGCESMHRDHLQIYSYKTLRTLFARADIELKQLVPCHVRFQEMISASHGTKAAGVRIVEWVVNRCESVAPMLSSGWIGVARL